MPEEGKKFKGNRGQAEGPGDVKGICFSRGERMQYYNWHWQGLHGEMVRKENHFAPFNPDGYHTMNSIAFQERSSPRRCAELSFTSNSLGMASKHAEMASKTSPSPRNSQSESFDNFSKIEVPTGHTIMCGGTSLERRFSFLDRRTPRQGLQHAAYTRPPAPSNRPPETFYDERPSKTEPLRTPKNRNAGEEEPSKEQSTDEAAAPLSPPETAFAPRLSFLANVTQPNGQRGSVTQGRASITQGRGSITQGRGSITAAPRSSISAAPRGSIVGDQNANAKRSSVTKT